MGRRIFVNQLRGFDWQENNVISKLSQAMWIPAGLMDDTLPVKVANHLHVKSKAAWDEIGGAATQHQEMPEDLSVLLPSIPID